MSLLKVFLFLLITSASPFSIIKLVMRKSKEIAAQVPPVIISRPKPIPKPKSTAKRSVAKAVLPPPKEVPIGKLKIRSVFSILCS